MRGSKKDMEVTMKEKGFEIREAEWGDMHIEYGIFKEDFDVTPFLKGLPGDRDQTPHWGYVIKGEMLMKSGDHVEVFKAGDMYYSPPGHTTIVKAGCEYVEFSPKKEYAKTMKVIAKNLENKK